MVFGDIGQHFFLTCHGKFIGTFLGGKRERKIVARHREREKVLKRVGEFLISM